MTERVDRQGSRNDGSNGRIRRRTFDVGPTYGAALCRIIDGLADHYGNDFMDRLDDLAPAQRSVAVLQFADSVTNADGLEAVYWDTMNLCTELSDAAEHIGADGYANLFRRVASALPPGLAEDWRARRSFLLEHEDALDVFERDFWTLEESEGALSHLLVRYIEAHPSDFFTDD
jgi:hypothetical protein